MSTNDNDILSPKGIRTFLIKPQLGDNIIIFKTLPSTNETAKKLAIEGAVNGTVVIADEQTAGKGRLGRSFFSPLESGIYMSIILRPNFKVENSVLITTAASVAVCKAIEKTTGIKPGIKWVNDIFVDGKKVCGILAEASSNFETSTIDYIILGIGINFNTNSNEFPKQLQNIAGSIYKENTNNVTRNMLIAEVINEVIKVVENIENRQFIREYKNRCIVLKKDIFIIEKDRKIAGRAVDVDENGGLVVQKQDGTIITLNTGEISIRGNF